MDEFHFYAEPDRGWAWQIPLLELPQAQFLLMSATLGDVSRFEEDLTRRTGRPTAVVRSATRPVPLRYEYRTTPLTETLTELLETRQSPVYIVHFTQAAAVERAQALMSINMCTRAEKDAIAELIGNFRFTTTFGRNLSRLRPARHRRAPRGHAAQVPAAGGEAGAGRPAEGHLRHRHPRRRRQRADPHGAVHRADQVRRHAGAGAAGPGVPPDRGPRGAGRLRHGGLRGGAGPRARHREREGARQGGRRPEEAPQGGAQEGARGLRQLVASTPSRS